MRLKPSVARPPACSIINAKGLHSYNKRNLPFGDFYWILEKDNLLFYATADCTGHGVPGGFMTMLGLSFLDEIVEAKKVTNPGMILDLMRDKIIGTLKQNGNFGESKDGMDITICVIDKIKKTLCYASANNPLYIVKNGDNNELRALHIYKADKQPCGFYHDYTPFTSQNIGLEEGDKIYTFSDGFPDQFGGANGKKFMHKQFKEILLKNSNLTFAQQKKDGTWMVYNDNGAKLFKMEYKEGEKVGTWIQWDDNGAVLKSTSYSAM
jgi:serine phosphatase RsbU (regulator of sigma subunit)